MIDARTLGATADRLLSVAGVVGVMLGGSRARGDHHPDSDVDLGLYYRPPLDVAALSRLAQELSDSGASVTEPGGWGPWVDGGGWLRVDDTPVDWIYRDLDRVQAAWKDAQAGRCALHAQEGHPLGFLDVAYAGEVALGVVLADPTGELTALRDAAQHYPRPLAETFVQRLARARFAIGIARKVVNRGDTAFVAGCLFRVVGLCTHALHGRAGRWLINEKGAVTAAGALPVAPAGFAERAHGLLSAIGSTPGELGAVLDRAEALVDDVEHSCTW
ncbi:nucleotidyltransferase domain-containing protein [Actinomycetes bacterium KLBMP 9759]